METIKIKLLSDSAVLPKRSTDGAAGYDLTVNNETYHPELGIVTYGFGFAIEIPEGYVGLLLPRSSVYKSGQLLTNSCGVIDSDYRGEVKAVFNNFESIATSRYKIGERAAQLLIVPIATPELEVVSELSETERGDGGYGSTGK